jgi:hypothetical protein
MNIKKFINVIINVLCDKTWEGAVAVDAEEAAREISHLSGGKSLTKVLLVGGAVCMIDEDPAHAGENAACGWVAAAELADSADLRECVILYRSAAGLWERLVVNGDRTITETQALRGDMTPEEAVRRLGDFET